jgi:hypothetical protein
MDKKRIQIRCIRSIRVAVIERFEQILPKTPGMFFLGVALYIRPHFLGFSPISHRKRFGLDNTWKFRFFSFRYRKKCCVGPMLFGT